MSKIMNNVKSDVVEMVLGDGRVVDVHIEISNRRQPFISVLSSLGEDITDEIGKNEFIRIAEVAFSVIDDNDLI